MALFLLAASAFAADIKLSDGRVVKNAYVMGGDREGVVIREDRAGSQGIKYKWAMIDAAQVESLKKVVESINRPVPEIIIPRDIFTCSPEDVAKNQFSIAKLPVFLMSNPARGRDFKQTAENEYRITWDFGDVYAVTDPQTANTVTSSFTPLYAKIVETGDAGTKIQILGNAEVIRGLDKVIGWK